MLEPGDLLAMERGAIVAPAGYGKTELIANVAALGRRTLVLTHTNAGIQAIRSRLKRLRVPQSSVAVHTISGWSLRYAHGFPSAARPPADLPEGEQWDEVHRGVLDALKIPAVRQVVEASYDRILIDEYQDCNVPQHALAIALSTIAPTIVFGDPMQGIFEFAGATLSWEDEIFHHFPLLCELDTPYRWHETNPELSEWIMDARGRLLRGERIEFCGPVAYREADDAFDMAALFESIDGKDGSVAAIHCSKGICYRIAAATRGGYQAIEEMAARTMADFARKWDSSGEAHRRLEALRWLLAQAFSMQKLPEDDALPAAEAVVGEALQAAVARLDQDAPSAALEIMSLTRTHPRARLYRQELLRDVERAIGEVAAGRYETVLAASARVRDRASIVGRKLPRRTVATPLLLKGLEFDHVIVPDASHFVRERNAQAKLFYVAISRPTRSLTITSQQRSVQFPTPAI